MSDSIDRQTAIEELKSYMVNPTKAISENSDDIFKYNSGIRTAVGVIMELPTISPWHRIESIEDLPKESGSYIVYLRQGTKVETPEWMGGEPLSYVTEMAFDRRQMLWRINDDAYNAILSFVDTEREFHVTHWTEEPKPPKEAQE